MQDVVRVGTGVIIRKGNKVLCGKRIGNHGRGTWGFAGGHLEMFESFEDSARREVLEETGLVVENIKFAAVTNDIFEEEKKHYVTIFIVCDYIEGEAKVLEPEKFLEWKWFEWDELPEPLFLPIINLKKTGFTPESI